MLSPQGHLLEVIHCVRLPSIIRFLLKSLKVFLLEYFLEDTLAVLKQFLAEVAVFQVRGNSPLSLRLQVNLNDS